MTVSIVSHEGGRPIKLTRLNRGEALARVLNAMNGGEMSQQQLCERTGLGVECVGPACYRLIKQGRIEEVRREGRHPIYRRREGAPPMTVARALAPRQTILARVLNLLGQLEVQSKQDAEEVTRLREENARLRRSVKELAGKL